MSCNDDLFLINPDNTVVIEQTPNTIVLGDESTTTVIQETVNTVVVPDSRPTVIIQTGLLQGPPGPPGPTGTSYITGITGENIGTYLLLVLIDGLIYKADPGDLSHVGKLIGISITAATIGNQIFYVQNGKIGGTGLITDARYYAGPAGVLSTNPTYGGALWRKSLGVAESPSAFVIILQSEVIVA